MRRFAVNPTQIGAGMNRPAPAGLVRTFHEYSPRRAANERRAFGANRYTLGAGFTIVPEHRRSRIECPPGYDCGGGAGRRISTVVPLPSTLLTEIFPLCAVTTDFAIAIPRPVPCDFPCVTKGSKSFGRSSAGIPTPVSEI